MVDTLQNPSQNDPLANVFILPRTLEGFPSDKGMDLDGIHSFLRSKAFTDPKELMEQATEILNSIAEDPNLQFEQKLPSKADNRKDAANDVDNLQKRRPALGRKRARFSYKSKQSEPVSHVDLSLDIDNLADPDDFFTACERLENAEKELKKSMGSSVADPLQHHQDNAARCRRQGILGRTVHYKHHYPKHSDNEENIIASQVEVPNTEIPIPSMGSVDIPSNNSSHLQAGQPGEALERETIDEEHLRISQGKGSVAETVDGANELLGELLFKHQNLDESQMVSVLQERLKVKPINLGKLSLPDFGSIQINDLRSLQETLSRRRRPLSDLQNVIQSTSNRKTPIKNKEKRENFRCPPTSPTPPRSSFASMSILKKPQRDQFSVSLSADVSSFEQVGSICEIDKQTLSPPLGTNPPDVNGSNAESDLVPQKTDGKFSPQRDQFSVSLSADVSSFEQVGSIREMDKETLPPPLGTNPPDVNGLNAESDLVTKKTDGKNSSLDCTLKSSGLEEGNVVAHDVNSEKSPIVGSACPSTDENIKEFENGLNIVSDGLESNSHDEVKDMQLEDSVDQNSEAGLTGLTTETVKYSNKQLGTHLSMDGQQLENPSISNEKHNEVHKVPNTNSLKRHRKQKATPSEQSEKEAPSQKQRKRELHSLRQSLAGTGTLIESGVRRSTRIKSRPLAYWRGERFLYGRIHNSLPTIIGKKYASPGKGGKEPVLKVTSYVSEEYAELVELAGLH